MDEVAAISQPRVLAGLAPKPLAVFLWDESAAERFFGFFTANHQNKNTRWAYFKAACRFSDWCEGGGRNLAEVKPPHVAAHVEWLGKVDPEGQGLSKPTVKQHRAALRMLFDWLVVGHVLDTNPAHAVRGPKYSQKKGKTPVLDRGEVRARTRIGRSRRRRPRGNGNRRHVPAVHETSQYLRWQARKMIAAIRPPRPRCTG